MATETNGDSARLTDRESKLRATAVAVAWVALTWALLEHGWRMLPRALLGGMTLASYNVAMLVVAAAAGLALGALGLRRPRATLGLGLGSGRAVALAVLLAPAVYVVGALLAQHVAWDTLLTELERRTVVEVQASSGAFGQELREGALPLVLLWTVVVTPAVEELIYRGALWGAVASFTARFAVAPETGAPASSTLPAGVIQDGAVVRGGRALFRWLAAGGAATVVSSTVFAAMHLGVPGAMGLIRVTNAAVLGLALGTARQHSRGIAAPILLHALCNGLTAAANRRWLVTTTFPKHYLVPTLPMVVAGGGLLAAVVVWLATRKRAD